MAAIKGAYTASRLGFALSTTYPPRRARAMNRLGIRSPRGLTAFAVVAGGLVTMTGAAVGGGGGVFVGAGVVGVVGDLVLQRSEPGLMGRLGRLHVGETLRFELRCVLLLLLLGRMHVTGPVGLASAMALVLCLLGGGLGVLVGTGGAMIMASAAKWNTYIAPASVALAFAFSAVVGLIFGLWPAWRAATLNTIDALRYE